MNIEGRLRISLAFEDGAVQNVRIESSRPLAATQVLRGKTPEQLMAIVPLLFSICGNAQAYAAQQACLRALGITAAPAVNTAGLMLLQLETLREHCWRILLDWPALLGLQADKKRLAPLLRFDALFNQHLFENGAAFNLDSRLQLNTAELARHIDHLETLLDAAIFAGRLSNWRDIATEAELIAWMRQNSSLPALLLKQIYTNAWQELGRNNVELLPDLSEHEWQRALQSGAGASFCRTPEWQGRCTETTPLNRQQGQSLIQALTRQYGNGLVTRIAARLLEAGATPARLRQYLAQLDAGEKAANRVPSEAETYTERRNRAAGAGFAQVQAARGLLLHHVQFEHGVVHDYRIVAPTEWNFHPDGVAAASLRQLRATNVNELQRQAEWLMQAIDPCVAYDICLSEV